MTYQEMVEFLIDRRKELGMPRWQVAAHMNTSERQVIKLEKYETIARIRTMDAWARALNCSFNTSIERH